MNLNRRACLFQCEKENDAGRAYIPAADMVSEANWLAEEGLISHAAIVGYYLTTEGVRTCVRLRREAALARA